MAFQNLDPMAYCGYKTVRIYHMLRPMSQLVWKHKYKILGVKKSFDIKYQIEQRCSLWSKNNPRKMMFLHNGKNMCKHSLFVFFFVWSWLFVSDVFFFCFHIDDAGENPLKVRNLVKNCWISGKEVIHEVVGQVKVYAKEVAYKVLQKLVQRLWREWIE